MSIEKRIIKKVLIVNDIKKILTDMYSTLHSRYPKVTVLTAASPDEAYEAAENFPDIDLVLMDYHLDIGEDGGYDITGAHVYRKMKDELLPDAEYIGASEEPTGLLAEGIEYYARPSEVFDYMEKLIKTDKLNFIFYTG